MSDKTDVMSCQVDVCKFQVDVCTMQFAEINAGLERIENNQTLLMKKLYQDNGKECIQSKINRHDQSIRHIKRNIRYAMGIIAGLLTSGAAFKLIYNLIGNPN